MHLSAALSLLTFTSTVIATRDRCGPKEPHDRLLADHRAQEADGRLPRGAKFGGGPSSYAVDPNASIKVATYVHVVTSSAKANDYSQQMVDDQIGVMNDSYGPFGINFALQNTSFTTNDDWASATDGSSSETDMKSSLRDGGYGDLNLYFLSDLSGGLLGVCPFPDEQTTGDSTFEVDGCMVLADSMPGGSETDYNLGGTAVHETGHWFGLLHVFQGDSCAPGGDHILDTPRQSTSTSGCPTNKDSCPGVQGLDSIHNYMDYSTDSCYEEFTSDQQTRMHNLYAKYRAAYATPV